MKAGASPTNRMSLTLVGAAEVGFNHQIHVGAAMALERFVVAA